MKYTTFILILSFLASASNAQPALGDADLRTIQSYIEQTEKLTSTKQNRTQLKYIRRQLDRVRELWSMGAIPNSLSILLNVRRMLYTFDSAESDVVQKNLRLVMQRLWPYILKSGRFRSDSETFHGVTYIHVLVQEGSFTMTFPADTKAGETVSGRIHASPPDLASLYLLTIMGKPVVADGNLRIWNLPESFDLSVSDHWNNSVVKTRHQLKVEEQPVAVVAKTDPNLQEEKQPREPKQNIEITHLHFQLSSRAKAGDYLILQGPFDGDFRTTKIGVGQYAGHILVESPRHLILAIHPTLAGDRMVWLEENEYRIRCQVQIQTENVDPFSTLETCKPL